ncbi:LysR family transcriptional regulator [Solimicrobium silvestre]|uniref:Transcriptional regulator n=1 Tax=Solimicrobium silvestre TaxID=2099400 RepID=A0A2S9H3S3_9BURK|nr:LysR family transcriptional regulator [Solimicrobium silvestre]PRC94632.1 Transcriptional regulator [Solimicrobium silvestre]
MNSPDWNDLRFFLALIDAGTLSGAARMLGVEHTTVARRIDALEAPLMVRLFDRFPKGWSLTSAGIALVPHARQLEEDMHALMRAATGSATLSGVVRLSAPPALAAYLLAPRLRAVLSRLPEIEIELLGESREADLMRRDADIALRFRRPSAPGLAVRTLTTIPYSLYASAQYLSQRTPQQWEFLGYNESLRDAPQQLWLDKIRGERRYALRSNDLGALFQAAVAGCGVTVLPTYFEKQHSELVRIESDCPVKRKLWIVMHEDVRRSARVRAIADEVISLFDNK